MSVTLNEDAFDRLVDGTGWYRDVLKEALLGEDYYVGTCVGMPDPATHKRYLTELKIKCERELTRIRSEQIRLHGLISNAKANEGHAKRRFIEESASLEAERLPYLQIMDALLKRGDEVRQQIDASSRVLDGASRDEMLEIASTIRREVVDALKPLMRRIEALEEWRRHLLDPRRGSRPPESWEKK